MKKGIALFSTLIILVLVSMLMSIALKNSTNIKRAQSFEKDLIQENLIINDIKTLLDNKIFSLYKSKSKEEQVYILNELITMPLSFKNPIDNSTIEVKFESSSGKMNLNTLMKPRFYQTRRNLFGKLNIIDPDLLDDIIKANLNRALKDELLVTNESYKLVFQEVDFFEGKIKSVEEFYKLFDIYVKLSDDIEAKAITWEDYIKFSDDDKLDINYMNMDLIDSLDEITLSSEVKTNINDGVLITQIEELGLSSTEQTKAEKTYQMSQNTSELFCNINIKSINFEVQYSFYYDIQKKSVSNIRMDRWNY